MIKPPFVRSPYNYDLKEASDSSGLDCSVDGFGRTKQSFAEEADINTLIRRFGIGNPLPQGARLPSYGDFTGVGSYQDALNVLDAADRAFYAVPADVRSRFGNNPGLFLDFFNKSENYDEALKLGLVVAREAPPAPVVPPVVPPGQPPVPPVK